MHLGGCQEIHHTLVSTTPHIGSSRSTLYLFWVQYADPSLILLKSQLRALAPESDLHSHSVHFLFSPPSHSNQVFVHYFPETYQGHQQLPRGQIQEQFSAFILAELTQMIMRLFLKHFLYLASKTTPFLASIYCSFSSCLVSPALPYLQTFQCPVIAQYWDLFSSPSSHSLNQFQEF